MDGVQIWFGWEETCKAFHKKRKRTGEIQVPSQKSRLGQNQNVNSGRAHIFDGMQQNLPCQWGQNHLRTDQQTATQKEEIAEDLG